MDKIQTSDYSQYYKFIVYGRATSQLISTTSQQVSSKYSSPNGLNFSSQIITINNRKCKVVLIGSQQAHFHWYQDYPKMFHGALFVTRPEYENSINSLFNEINNELEKSSPEKTLQMQLSVINLLGFNVKKLRWTKEIQVLDQIDWKVKVFEEKARKTGMALYSVNCVTGDGFERMLREMCIRCDGKRRWKREEKERFERETEERERERDQQKKPIKESEDW